MAVKFTDTCTVCSQPITRVPGRGWLDRLQTWCEKIIVVDGVRQRAPHVPSQE